jgi:hypothetical protein
MKGRGVWSIAGLALVAAAAGAVLWLAAPGGQAQPARILEVVNRVEACVHAGDAWTSALAGMAVYGGGQVRTGPASSARLELSEGVVRLSPESVFTVKENTMRRGRRAAALFLEEGRLWAHLAGDPPHEFRVETASAVAAVRDTHFSVRVAADQGTLVSVAAGEVEVTAQGRSVRVGAGEQASVEPGRPPDAPQPMSDAERALWASEGERPELAPPTPEPGATPIPVTIGGDVYVALEGRAGDVAARRPATRLEAWVESRDAAQVVVEGPGGERWTLPPYGDIYGEERRFFVEVPGLPRAGEAYTFTALDADGMPLPGRVVAQDVYLGGFEPEPPANVRAEVVDNGLQVTWDPVAIIPGAFEPGADPPLGFYQINLTAESGPMVYGRVSTGAPLPETAHLIPLRRRDFGAEHVGQALEELGDGVYYLNVNAFSRAPEGSAGHGHECGASDATQRVSVVIEGGRLRVETP